MDGEKNQKIERVLGIYTKLLSGSLIDKEEEAQNYGVNVRSIQRDIDDIRSFLDMAGMNTGQMNTVVYDRSHHGYRLERNSRLMLKNSEILAVCKILLDSRAFPREEMTDILDRMVACCVPEVNRKVVEGLVRNEEFHYVEPRHKTDFLDTMWEIGQAIQTSRYIEVDYFRTKDKSVVKRKLKPVALMFSEFYFYLTAFIDDEEVKKDFSVLDDAFPTIYRIDRIRKLKVLDEHFHIPYHSRFEEGEFRKRIQFMYGGKLRKIRFQYCGDSIEAVLDRLPTAKVLGVKDGVYTVSAEVFGDGIDMWLRSQGERVKVIENSSR